MCEAEVGKVGGPFDGRLWRLGLRWSSCRFEGGLVWVDWFGLALEEFLVSASVLSPSSRSSLSTSLPSVLLIVGKVLKEFDQVCSL